MSADSGLAPAGSSTYSSNTLHVGDGTWDSNRDVFLLPNLVGLNLDTLRYNGMGNRFADMPDYHRLVVGHAVLAAITFLFIVPAAIFVARFYRGAPFFRTRLHIWLQIVTVFTSTVIITLGCFAVGPERSLTNPHHGIGIAIYVLILFQTIFGWLVRKLEKKRQAWRVTVKMMLHQWIGRATALLAITQVALGLALYGSPKVLFVLYALWMFVLIFVWFILSHRYQTGDHGDGHVGGVAGSEFHAEAGTENHGEPSPEHHGGGLLKVLAAGGVAAAALGWWERRKHRREDLQQQQQQHDNVTEYTEDQSHYAGRPPHHQSQYSQSSASWDEKHDNHKEHTWRNRLLAGAGIATVAGIAGRLFNRKREEKIEQEQHHHQENASEFYSQTSHDDNRTDYSRMEEGRPPITPGGQRIRRDDDLAVPVAVTSPSRQSRLHARRSGGSIYSSTVQSYAASPGQEKKSTHGVRNSIAAVGIGAFLMNKFGRKKKEEQRVEEIQRRDEEAERLQRQSSLGRPPRFTGDGRMRPTSSYTESDFQSSVGPGNRHGSHRTGAALAGVAAGAVGAEALHHHNQYQNRPEASQHSYGESIHSSSQHNTVPMLPPNPPYHSGHHANSSGSEAYQSQDSRRHQHHHDLGLGATAAAGGLAAGAALAEANRRTRRESANSPLSLKLHTSETPQGRQKITIKRLTEEEAARERESSRLRAQRAGASATSFGMSDDERWRRTEARERAEAAEMTAANSPVGDRHRIPPGSIPPPPVPLHSSSPPLQSSQPPPIPGSVTAGSGIGGDTGASAAGSRADSNRRRRRAERARQEASARAEGRGPRVGWRDDS